MKTMRLIALLSILTSGAFSSGYTASDQHLPGEAPCELVEQKSLQDVLQDFATGKQLCFDPFLLDQPQADDLAAVMRVWHIMKRRASKLEEAGQGELAERIVAGMDQFVQGFKQLYQKVQMLTLGAGQTAYAVLGRGLSSAEQQQLMLTVLVPLAKMLECAFQTKKAKPVGIDNACVSKLLYAAYQKYIAGGASWFNGSEQEAVRAVLALDLWHDYEEIARSYYDCLVGYGALFTGKRGAGSKQEQAADKQLKAYVQQLKDTLSMVNVSLEGAESASARRALCYIASHVTSILEEVEPYGSSDVFNDGALEELYAWHLAIIQSAGFCLIKRDSRVLAERYEWLMNKFFKHQPDTPAFRLRLRKLAREVRFEDNLRRRPEARTGGDYFKYGQLVFHALVLGTANKDPRQETLFQMIKLLEACTEWHTKEGKPADSLLEALVPRAMRDNATVQRFLQNKGGMLGTALALGVVPAGYKVASLVQEYFAKKQDKTTDPAIEQLLQLAKDNPAMFDKLAKQEPKILERLAAHLASAKSAEVLTTT